MLELQQAIELSEKNAIIENRTLTRLTQFMTVKEIEDAGFNFTDEEVAKNWKPTPYTQENLETVLKSTLEFAFEKALNQRGISSALLFRTVLDLNIILENELASWPEDKYGQYGLPLYKATAELYGWDNPIGGDVGDEEKYSAE